MNTDTSPDPMHVTDRNSSIEYLKGEADRIKGNLETHWSGSPPDFRASRGERLAEIEAALRARS
jgi:hypothetical protein